MYKKCLLGLMICVLSVGLCAMKKERIIYRKKARYVLVQLLWGQEEIAQVRFYQKGLIKCRGDKKFIDKIIRARMLKKEEAEQRAN